MIATAAAGLIFLCAILVATSRGFALAAVVVYIPAILFMSTMVPTNIPLFPDVDSTSATGYGLLLVALFRGHEFRAIKLNAIDYLMLLVMGWSIVSVIAAAGAWNAVSVSATQLFQWIMPFALGRLVMMDGNARALLLKVVAISAMVIGGLAMLEARINPYFVSRIIEPTGLITINNTEVMYRYGLARAQVLTPHPIDLGNVGVMLGVIIVMLTPIVGRRWQQPLPLWGVIGAGGMVIASVSFTCFLALALCFALFYVFTRRGVGQHLVMPTMIAIILGLTVVTSVLLSRTIDLEADPDTALTGSLTMRTIIVQGVWNVVQNSNLGGLLYGYDTKIPGLRIGTGSIDNAYMLLVLKRGWPCLFLWVGLALAVAWRGTGGLLRARTKAESLPLAAALAGAIAIFAAMYTVWFGFIYAQLFVFLLGMISSMSQMLQQRDAPAFEAEPSRRRGAGFDVIPNQRGGFAGGPMRGVATRGS